MSKEEVVIKKGDLVVLADDWEAHADDDEQYKKWVREVEWPTVVLEADVENDCFLVAHDVVCGRSMLKLHACTAPEAEVARLRRGLERMSGHVGFVVAAWPWALTTEEIAVVTRLRRGMFKIADNLLAGREWDDPSPTKDLSLKSEVEAATIYDGHAAFDGRGNVTISVKEFNELLAYKRRVISG